MKDIDPASIEQNEYIQALQSMAYDATAEQILEKLYVIYPPSLQPDY